MSRWSDPRPCRYADAVALEKVGDLAGAARAYRRLSPLWPDHRSVIRYNLASVLLRQALARRAAVMFAALADDPAVAPSVRAGSHFHLGRIAEERGQPTAARDHFRAALVLLPEHAAARSRLAVLDHAAVATGAPTPRRPRQRRPPRPGDDRPILVYQMGKVASNSVYAGLRQALPHVEIAHSHLLDPGSFAHYERWFADDPQLPDGLVASTREQIAEGRTLRSRIDGAGPRWRVVTLTREPLGHLVSVLFHHLEIFVRLAHAGPAPCLDAVHAYAVETLQRWAATPSAADREPARAALTLASRWFDIEPAASLGLDVYATPFPFERGYARHRTARAEVVVLRVEDLDWAAGDAMRSLCGVDRFVVPAENRAQDRASGPLHAQYLRTYRFPAPLVAAIYDTRYARHFYTDAERAALTARWAHPGS